ncbi:hypothetical protein Slin15195_G109320 [Septoria linicola]|uniref:Uncharacterized protein n=1 Tax=Septoria linicola TaxID=215465 RepID=A0A9Q9B511_9PEZI|nr:hypothetical protein Slin14017_G107680 [Septoria linicola]USW57613.1 hypothetical protein Slin15195_G109320 [Septoria linicola]
MGGTIAGRQSLACYSAQKSMTETTNTSQHWLQRTPTEFLQRYVNNEWQASGSHDQLRKIRYYSFTVRAFVFRGDKLFLTNRNGSSGLMEELTVPTDRFDITTLSNNDGEPPLYQVNQLEERSISEHIRTVLSSRYQHPNILQNARFLDEFSTVEPSLRRRVEAKTWGEEEIYLCDIEISIVMSKYDGSLGNGPAFRWITASEAESIDNELQFVAGLDASHVQEMFSRFRRCRENQAFHEYCTEEVRSRLRARWKTNEVDRSHRYGIIAQRTGFEAQGIFLFTMSSTDAARWKDAASIFHQTLRYQIVGRFAVEAVQLKSEVETWTPVLGSDGRLIIQWCDSMSKASSFIVLTP